MPKRPILIVLVLATLGASACGALGRGLGEAPTRVDEQPAGEGTGARPFAFVVKGDWGAGTENQRAVTRRMCLVRKRLGYRFVLTTGDNFYNPDGEATDSNYWSPEDCLINAAGHTWRASWGNHDLAGDSTAEVLGATDRYYAWSARKVDFFVLDSNDPFDEEQRKWLRRNLAGSDAAVTIVVFHHPPYSVGSVHGSNEAVQENWVPLFRRFDVTLVLSGHDHNYQHARERGVDYVVTGGGGGAIYACEGEEEWLKECIAAYHFLLVKVRGSVVEVIALDPAGEELDRFTITA